MTQLKSLIDANIKNNGNQEVTGNVLNYVLTEVAKHTDKDWYESSETKSGYIYGRTHGVTSEFVKVEGTLTQLGYKSGEYVSVLHYPRLNGVLEGEQLYLNGLVYNPIIGQEYNVNYDGPNVYARIVAVEGGFDVQIKGSLDTGNSIKIALVWIKTLDDAYISGNIARKSEVDTLETKVNDKADNTGIYPSMQVGKADDLSGHGESVPAEFTFRATGGKSIKDGTATIKEMEGNAVVWNQLQSASQITKTLQKAGISIDTTAGSLIMRLSGIYDGTKGDLNFYVDSFFKNILGVKGHKYVCIPKGLKNAVYTIFGGINNSITYLKDATIVTCTKEENIRIVPRIDDRLIEGTEYNEDIFFSCVDLTKMYGEGNEPTTIEEFNARKPIVADEYAYNEGEVIAFCGDAVKSVGDNAWDEQWEKGRLNAITGQPNYGANGILTKNFNKVLPNETYYCGYDATPIFAMCYDAEYNLITQVSGSNNFINIRNRQFTTPANAVYMKFYVVDITTYNHDIMITLVHSGWKVDTNAGYQPYWADTLQIDSRIKAEFPNGMHKWDKVYNKDGKGYIVKGTGVVDLGTLEWLSYQPTGTFNVFYTGANPFPASYNNNGCNIISKRYIVHNTGAADFPNLGCKLFMQSDAIYPRFYIRDDAYTDAASFKAAMAGTMLYYELAEPTIIEYDKPFKLDYKVADFGTEQLISAQPSAPFKARTIYQFNAVDQIRENYNEIERIKAALAKAGITLDL